MAKNRFRGRREDLRLLTGRGRYTADWDFDAQASAYFVRSDRAHARILEIDTAEAQALSGVLDVLTGADLIATGWKGMPSESPFKGISGSSLRVPFRTGLACGRVRFVGEPVVLVVAQSEHVAQDAAELVKIKYHDLPVLVEAVDSIAPGAVLLHDELPDNLAFDYEYGDEQATQKAFAAASHIARVQVCAQRVAGSPIEPKSCVASYDSTNGAFELRVPTQGAEDIRSPRSPLLLPIRACEALMMAGAGGATRARGWRATANRFQQLR